LFWSKNPRALLDGVAEFVGEHDGDDEVAVLLLQLGQ
jgi:hypothetical protein